MEKDLEAHLVERAFQQKHVGLTVFGKQYDWNATVRHSTNIVFAIVYYKITLAVHLSMPKRCVLSPSGSGPLRIGKHPIQQAVARQDYLCIEDFNDHRCKRA